MPRQSLAHMSEEEKRQRRLRQKRESAARAREKRPEEIREIRRRSSAKNSVANEARRKERMATDAEFASHARQRDAEYRKQHPEKFKGYREKRKAQPELVEQKRAAGRADYYKHREDRLVKAKTRRDKKREASGKTPRVPPTASEKLAKAQATKRRCYEKNKVKYLAAAKEREKENPEKTRERGRLRQHKRRAKLAGSNSPGVTTVEWSTIVDYFDHACAYCLQPATSIEHLHPIAVGGEDAPYNVVPACLRCNKSKGKKMTLRWLLTSKIAQEALL